MLVEVLNLRFNAILGAEMLQERLQVVREARALAEELHDPVARLFASCSPCSPTSIPATDGEIDRASEAAMTLADQIGQPTLRWIAMWTRVLRSWLDGDLEAAETQTNDAFALGFESEQPDATVVPGVLLMFLRWAQGRTEEIEPVLTQMLGDNVQLPGLKAGLAMMHCENGNFDEARAVAAAEVAVQFASIENDPYQLNSMVMWCHAVADSPYEAASALLPRLAPHREDVGAASVVTAGHGGDGHGPTPGRSGPTGRRGGVLPGGPRPLRATGCAVSRGDDALLVGPMPSRRRRRHARRPRGTSLGGAGPGARLTGTRE